MTSGIYEAWQPLGGEPVEGSATAANLKDVESWLIVASSTRKFRVTYSMRAAGDDYPWKLTERHVLGTKQISEHYEPLDEFRSFKEARTEARKLARASVIR